MAEKESMPMYNRYRSSSQHKKILRWRSLPTLAAVLGTVLALFLFSNLFSGLQRCLLYIMPGSGSARATPADWEGWPGIDSLFVFGESYSSSKFDVDGKQPSLDNPFGNPETFDGSGLVQTGQTGPLWVHYAATKYNESVIKTYDFAVGGSTIDRDLVNPVFPTATTLGDQVVKQFTPHYGAGTSNKPWKAKSSLFAVFFGAMDMIITFHNGQRPPIGSMIQVYLSALNELYSQGARNFLIFTIPALDKSYVRSRPGVTELARDIELFNEQLRIMSKQFTDAHSGHDGANAFFFDIHSLFEDVIERPKRFPQTAQFSYTKASCSAYDLGIGFEGIPDLDRFNSKCGVPVSQYLWHDEIHVTYPMHDAIASLVVEHCMGPYGPKGYCSL